MAKRELSGFERQQVELVFLGSLDYGPIRIVEESSFPNIISGIGAWLSRTEPPESNSVTLGNSMYFPVTLRSTQQDFEDGHLRDFAWLIHELTHVWQYQHVGIRYLFEALWEQIRLGPQVYEYGDETGLIEARAQGKGLQDFNREQQGDIVRDFYTRKKRDLDTGPWEPFIEDLRNPGLGPS